MRQELFMPKLGLTMTEGTIIEWLAQPGAPFKEGQVLFVVETEKIVNEIAAESDGLFLESVVPAGETVPVGAVIGYWDDGKAQSEQAPVLSSHSQDASNASSTVATTASAPAQATNAAGMEAAGTGPAQYADASARSRPGARVVASPLARRLAIQRGIALETIRGSGPKGRIVARDIPESAAQDAHLVKAASVSTRATGAQAASRVAQTVAGAENGATTTQPSAGAQGAFAVVAPSATQSTIAKRLTRSKQETPHFYLALDVDVTRLTALREEIKRERPDVRLTFNHFIVAAVARALKLVPAANRVWSDAGILTFDQIDIGIAVDTEHGLLAPAVRSVGNMSLAELARAVDAVVGRARSGKLTADDMGMPAITVSNAGMYNVTYMSSIISPGQAMILGVGSIKEVFRPDASGQPVLRKEMGLVLSADHRITDGAGALKFLNCIADQLSRPVQLLVG